MTLISILSTKPQSPIPNEQKPTVLVGGLPTGTDLRAGLAWDDLDNKAQKLWSSLASAVSGLTSGTESE